MKLQEYSLFENGDFICQLRTIWIFSPVSSLEVNKNTDLNHTSARGFYLLFLLQVQMLEKSTSDFFLNYFWYFPCVGNSFSPFSCTAFCTKKVEKVMAQSQCLRIGPNLSATAEIIQFSNLQNVCETMSCFWPFECHFALLWTDFEQKQRRQHSTKPDY